MDKKNIDKKTIGNWFIIAGILIITTLEWHFYDWYQSFTKYGTLITFFSLVGAFFCYVNIKDALKDRLFWLMAVTDIIAMVNLLILGSNKGCLLIVVDFMLILYLVGKIEFSTKESYFLLVYITFFFFYWTVDVKGYFKGYNTNYGGLILITGFAFLIILLQVFNGSLTRRYWSFYGELGKAEGSKSWWKRYWWYVVLYLFFVALAFNIISWYRSRTALMGLIVILAILVLPRQFIMKKAVYNAICVLATLGSVVFSGLYILIGNLSGGDVQLFYKDIISGRNEIWNELWRAFLENPITGIGSSYEMKLEFMEGMLEAHSAMMDILVIHGIVIFVLVCGMLIYRLFILRDKVDDCNLGKAIFAAIIGILVTGFFENYYIVQPFSLIFLCLLSFSVDKIDNL